MLLPPLPIATAVIFADGLMGGLFIGSTMVEHAARHMSAPSWIDYKHAKEKFFGPVMPKVFMAGLLLTTAAAVLHPSHLPLAIAALIFVGVLAITLLVHLPLNKLFTSWSAENHPVTWDTGRRRWRDWNLARAVLMVLAFALVLVACL